MDGERDRSPELLLRQGVQRLMKLVGGQAFDVLPKVENRPTSVISTHDGMKLPGLRWAKHKK